ncbi:hypothetical protein GCM10025872_24170 [Barrientosiimonas endolithica]|uniref:Aldehyde dehydrogenase domain-containing protein n=1 Tax=Barrientosiimonas endolithica TaxID=1535208 RepID=A0ABN6YRT5_9MICO|nr:hypothetical protein GCM10025872_24170 [Barrientosiimonas endolithica]
MSTDTQAAAQTQTQGGLSGREQQVVDQVEKRLLVGGRWVDAEGGATFEVDDPATGQVIASVADATPADGRRALDAAVAAQADFARTTPRERADLLLRAHELLMERQDDLALLMTLEMGKPLAEARARSLMPQSFSGTSRARRCASTADTRPRRPVARGSS